MLDWLNENQGAVIALANVALVVMTGVYVWLTLLVVRQTRSALAGALLTVLEVTYDGTVYVGNDERHEFNVHVVNVGNGPAIDLRAELTLGGIRMEGHGERWGPTDLAGVAQAHEPRPAPPPDPPGMTTIRGSALEDAFTFFAPDGWIPPASGFLDARARVTWRDSLGVHRFVVPIELDLVMIAERRLGFARLPAASRSPEHPAAGPASGVASQGTLPPVAARVDHAAGRSGRRFRCGWGLDE